MLAALGWTPGKVHKAADLDDQLLSERGGGEHCGADGDREQ